MPPVLAPESLGLERLWSHMLRGTITALALPLSVARCKSGNRGSEAMGTPGMLGGRKDFGRMSQPAGET